MMKITLMSFIIFMICFIVMLTANLISKKPIHDREKSSPFECGFDPKSAARLPFSLQFFLIAVIFLIFDVEITLLIPMIYVMKISNLLNFSLIMIFFLFVLLMGLYHEWNQGALTWAI
uniref:NADH-ubiquinone oxidoreductase chain 3 n=1 Tax=Elateroidea sp. BMNH 1274768 TaxID=1796502 RepID=A0A140EGI0_9COLE|nr:NADH dehydrogenase subunit 3 [Elateroidea sp. BMNH 1274768]